MGQRQTILEDLTKCGICKETITDPRALPCLHTYCLDCLREWTGHNTDIVTCPMCKKDVSLPPDRWTTRLPSTKKTRVCICCEEAKELVARCLECNGFLCHQGAEAHKTLKMMKNHQVVSIDDLKSGRIDVRMLSKPPNCGKHKDQTLWLFCETCGVLICQGCTILDHSKPVHTYLELNSVIGDQKVRIEKLERNCDEVSKEINEEITQMITTKDNLDNAVTTASLAIEKAAMWKKHIDKLCQEQKDRLRLWETATNDEIHEKKECLDGEAARLKTAQHMAKQILLSGTDYDVASVYGQLTASLEEVTRRAPPKHVSARYNVEFEAVEAAKVTETLPKLGTLKLGVNE